MKNRNETGGFLEYICYSLRMKDFRDFCDKCDTKLLKHELCDRYFIKYLKLCSSINKSTFYIPFFGFAYYYFNNKYLGQVSHIYNNDEDISKYAVVLHYSISISNKLICKQISSFLKKIRSLTTDQRNLIFKKCIELSNDNDYLVFKNSPILTDGIINEIQDNYA